MFSNNVGKNVIIIMKQSSHSSYVLMFVIYIIKGETNLQLLLVGHQLDRFDLPLVLQLADDVAVFPADFVGQAADVTVLK